MVLDAQAAPKLAVHDPAGGELVAELDIATPQQVREAVERAAAAQPAWAALPVRERSRILRRFIRLLHERRTEVARLITRETGKPCVEALFTEVLVALDAADYAASEAYAFLRPERVAHANLLLKSRASWLIREPYGVIGIISPWNYPLGTPATGVFPALITGNAVVLKPSEFTPATALELAKLLHEAGVPPDVFQVVVGEGPVGAALVESGIHKLVFTGSVATGRRVAEAAARRLLPVVLELGGKDPMLVLDDADLDVASTAAVWGAFMNAGQTCLSVERCYVHRSLYDKFLAACAEKTARLRVGPGMDPNTDIGPMIHQRQLQIVETQVEEARRRGARVVCGGRRLPELGPNFYAPTILTGVTPDMAVLREETFGPVLPVLPFDSDEEAVALANATEFGLAASVWTGNRARGEALARRLEAGTVMVNDVISCFGIREAPHGGVKSSGIGRTHGRTGFEEMVRLKYLDSDRLPRMKKVWWYGYGPQFARQIDGFIDFLFGRGSRRLRGGLRSLGAYWRQGRF